jgi:hypothetical protein
MSAIRKVYNKLPASITTPEEFRQRKVEVIIFVLENDDSEKPQKRTCLLSLVGGLEKSKLALHKPLKIQEELRNEWN